VEELAQRCVLLTKFPSVIDNLIDRLSISQLSLALFYLLCFIHANQLLLNWSISEQVYEFVQLSELYYAGSHGMDIMGPARSSSGFKVNGTRAQDKKVNLFSILQNLSHVLEFVECINYFCFIRHHCCIFISNCLP